MKRVVLAILVVLSLAVAAKAQTFRGAILGTVRDASGAEVPGAKVTVRNQDTGIERTTETSADGSYRVPELPIGIYTVAIEKSGFQKTVTRDVTVDVAGESRVDASLKPGQVTEQVEVSAETLPQIEPTTDVLGAIMTPSQISNLPINGRDYTKLIYLSPGISGSPDQITDSPGSFGVFS